MSTITQDGGVKSTDPYDKTGSRLKIVKSQGAATFQMATRLVDSPSILSKIRNQSFGGQAYNDANALGLASSRNVWNTKDKNLMNFNKDWVPGMGMLNPLNAIQTIRKVAGSDMIDTTSKQGNNHAFKDFYQDSIQK